MSVSTAVVTFGANWIMQLDAKPGVLYWTCPLAVDADGHPECYHPDGSPPGLDYLANAGSPGNWWGIATDIGGKPYVQSKDDMAPGFYVSTTALEDNTISGNKQARYVNSGKIPFIVLPSKPKFSSKQALGDLAMCFNTQNGKSSWAIYADIGPSNQIGEGSMALNLALGLSDSPKTGGTSKEIIAMVFWPGSRVGWPRSAEELSAKAQELFAAWGGFDSCKLAMSQFDWTKFSSS
jgi:Fungal chitosanase of glycosyl hydrolase group 75